MPQLQALVECRMAVDDRIPLIGFSGAPFTLASYLIEGKPSRTWTKTKRFMLERPDDWVGPMMTVPKRNSDGQAISEKGVPVREDKPLYEKLEDEKKDHAHG